MSAFVKLYASILDSSVWLEDHATVRVWISMLAMADADGLVEASVGGLAARARVTRDECELALQKFQNPDPDSKSHQHEGRRVQRVDRGWMVLNHRAYRDLRTADQVAAAERTRAWRVRQRVTGDAGDVTGDGTHEARRVTSVTDTNPGDVTSSTDANPGQLRSSSPLPAAVRPSNGAETRPRTVTGDIRDITKRAVCPEAEAEVDTTTEGKPSCPPRRAAVDRRGALGTPTDVREVFEHWQAVMGKQRCLLSRDRERYIRARLREGRTVAELKGAIDGCRADPHMMGDNDRNTAYNDLENILRNNTRVDKLLAVADRRPNGKAGISRELAAEVDALLGRAHEEEVP